ncbi:MAG: acylneuraminate cytidylyltransferase family protein [Cyclobacteriaceae bacterium]|nr:acylneuraminate cytidylyltransferase family protein [Cyclobacteriaceae bacterium]
MEVLAVIPARGGSKGLVKKNTLPLAGHPLIAYSIQAAHDAKLVTRTIVNTDAEYIATAASEYNAEIPFMRPVELAGDFTTDLEVFIHALQWLKANENYIPDYVVQLRPTSPVRPIGIVDACIKRLMESDADSIRVVTKAPVTPYKMWRIENEHEAMIPLLELPGVHEPFNQPRQKLPEVFWQIGCLDVIRTSVISEQHSMSGKRILPYIVPYQFAVDIDDLESFKKAETVIAQENCTRVA